MSRALATLWVVFLLACEVPGAATRCGPTTSCPSGYRCDSRRSFCYRVSPGDAGRGRVGGVVDAHVDVLVLDGARSDASVADLRPPDREALDREHAADTAILDAALPDTGPPDTASPDTGPPDTALPDTAPPDTALPDTALPDTSAEDAGGWSLDFETSFGDPSILSSFATQTNSWTVDGGRLHQDQVSGHPIHFMYRQAEYEEVLVEVDLVVTEARVGGRGQVGLTVRTGPWLDLQEGIGTWGYACHVNFLQRWVALGVFEDRRLPPAKDLADADVVLDQPYHLRLWVQGDHIQCELSGEGLGGVKHVEFHDSSLTRGQVGIRALEDRAAFDNFRVWSR